MAYCVKCGVELDESASKCVLCETPVILIKTDENAATPFSKTPNIPKGIKKKFVASIVSMLMIIPSISCAVVNIFFQSQGYWSVYVIGTVFLVWIIAVLPFLQRKVRPYLTWAFDTFAVAAYAYIFYPLTRTNSTVYLTLTLPIILCVSACVLFFIKWGRKKARHWSSVMIHILVDILVICIVVGLIYYVHEYTEGIVTCLIIALSTLSLIGFGIYCNKSPRMRAWLEKKLFV